jgi:uncharacterized membrane protein
LNKDTNKRKTHAQIKTIEQRYIQEENTLCVCFPLVCIFVQLFLYVRVFSSCLCLWTKVLTRRKHTHRWKQLNKDTYKRKTHAQIKTIDICAFVFLLFVPLFHCFYLCVCFPLVCTFVQLFLSVRVFSSCLYLCSNIFICACVLLWKTDVQIKTIEQMYNKEDNTRTDKNNWLFNCLYLYICFPLVCTFVQLFLSVPVFSSCLYL